MAGGMWGAAKGAIFGAKLTSWIPLIGAPLAVATGFIGGMIGYFGGSKIGDTIYSIGAKVAGAAKNMAKTALNGLASAGKAIGSGIKRLGKSVVSRLGF